MKIRANVNMAVHPVLGTPTVFAWGCNNYMVTQKGAGECIHRTPKKIFEV